MSGDRLGDSAKQGRVFCMIEQAFDFVGKKMRILHKKGWYDKVRNFSKKASVNKKSYYMAEKEMGLNLKEFLSGLPNLS